MARVDQAPTTPARRLRLAAAIAGLLMAMPAGLFPQAPRRPPTFEAGVDVTRLNLTVTGEGNRFIAGLSEGDFTVFEDGVRQELSAFTRDPLPLSVALLVDCSGSMEAKLRTAQEAGVRFVKTLHPEDLGQVVQFNERISILQDFTADQRTLEAAIRGTQASGSTALYTALYVNLKQLPSQGRPDAPPRHALDH